MGRKRIQVLFDSRAAKKGLRTGWGMSFLVDEAVLFDTGENGQWLLENMQQLGVDVKKIAAVVISHDHWDHTGGLEAVLKERPDIPVFVCSDVSTVTEKLIRKYTKSVIKSKEPQKVRVDIFTSGEILTDYKGAFLAEQALVVKSAKGLVILTGCAHPGITRTVEKIKGQFPQTKILLAAGGFHLMNAEKRVAALTADELLRLGVARAGPTHCTGDEAEKVFKDKFGKNFIAIKVGTEIPTS